MNVVELQRKLLAVERANPPSDRVPLAFEKRIMALIVAQTQPVLDRWAAWAKGLWFAAAPCVAIMLLLSGWAFFSPQKSNPSSTDLTQLPSTDLALQFDKAMLAAVDQDSDIVW